MHTWQPSKFKGKPCKKGSLAERQALQTKCTGEKTAMVAKVCLSNASKHVMQTDCHSTYQLDANVEHANVNNHAMPV